MEVQQAPPVPEASEPLPLAQEPAPDPLLNPDDIRRHLRPICNNKQMELAKQEGEYWATQIDQLEDAFISVISKLRDQEGMRKPYPQK